MLLISPLPQLLFMLEPEVSARLMSPVLRPPFPEAILDLVIHFGYPLLSFESADDARLG